MLYCILCFSVDFRSVSDLARVGLKSPLYVSVHEKADQTTPATLEQSYIVCDLYDKLNTLWFFVKHHLKSKILVFLQSAKQVSVHKTCGFTHHTVSTPKRIRKTRYLLYDMKA